MFLCTIHNGADDDMLVDLAWNACEGDRSVVSWFVPIPFLEYWDHIGCSPVCWNNASVKEGLEEQGQRMC